MWWLLKLPMEMAPHVCSVDILGLGVLVLVVLTDSVVYHLHVDPIIAAPRRAATLGSTSEYAALRAYRRR